MGFNSGFKWLNPGERTSIPPEQEVGVTSRDSVVALEERQICFSLPGIELQFVLLFSP